VDELLAQNESISIRKVQSKDLEQIAPHGYSVSITDPLDNKADLQEAHSRTGFWRADAGAVSIVERMSDRLVGTCQFFRSGPCIHGLEIGYITHSERDRRKGFASAGLKLLSEYLFDNREQHLRHQLTIETSNLASCRVAEKCDFLLEGTLRSSGFPLESPADCFVYSKISG